MRFVSLVSRVLPALALGVALFAGVAAPAHAQFVAPDPATVIEQAARDHGVSPSFLVRLSRCESDLDPSAVGDDGTSFGAFQLHEGGLLGAFYADGYSDPFDVGQSADFAAGYIARHGAGAWSCSTLVGSGEMATQSTYGPLRAAWTGLSPVEFTTFCWVDQSRADRGVHRLRYSATLSESAHDYAVALAARGVLTHYLDGTTPVDRAVGDGYPSRYVGEIAAEGQPTPAVVTAAWIHSPEHLENLTRPEYVEMGVGVATDARGVTWWVVDFGDPNG